MATTLSDRVMVITRSVETIFSERSRATGRIVLVAEGIDVERFSPIHSGQRVRTELGIEDGRALVGWAGRLDPWKGAEVFLRAAARVAAKHPSARFAIFGGELVGYQDYAMELHELSAKLGLQDKLTFTGWQYGWDDMPEVMAAVDVLVHTSVRPEPLGLVVLEAMATGKPVVASDAGGPREVVQPGKTGYLCTPGNDVQIAEAVGNLLESNELRDEMGEAGRQSVQVAFDAGRYANEIAQLFEEVLA
jgi:glycosyltransferase involved in cell wall biosynthesis